MREKTQTRPPSEAKRGYFGIGICDAKIESNVGTLWRTAYQMGADFIFTIGRRFPHQSSDTCKAWKHIPYFRYESFDAFMASVPKDCPLIGVEFGGISLADFQHPDRAIYLLGAEDYGLNQHIQERMQSIVELPSVRSLSYNVAVAGAVVMADRMMRRCKMAVEA